MVDDKQFWMATPFLSVDWKGFMNENARSLTQQQRNIVLAVSGHYSISPLILISKLMVEQQSAPDSLKIAEHGFLQHVREIANSSKTLYEGIEIIPEKPKNNSATSTLWSLLGKNDNLLKSFIDKYNQLFEETGLSSDVFYYNGHHGETSRVRRYTIWPLKGRLKTGACHGNYGTGSISSSFDVHKNHRWGDNTPWVVAAHHGRVKVFSDCYLRISDGGRSTGYYHLENIQVKDGDHVSMGQTIAKMANTEAEAVCDGGRASGPHVHFTNFDYHGREHSWNGYVLSGYTIHAKITNNGYEENCNFCNVQKGGRRYCPFKWIEN